MEKITFEKVYKTYNGKAGCMCGCLGKYSLPSADMIEEGNRRSGYCAYSEEDVKPRSVKIAISKVNKALEAYGHKALFKDMGSFSVYEYSLPGLYFAYCDEWVSIEENGRNTTVYLKKED